jgi:hypothetical protein
VAVPLQQCSRSPTTMSPTGRSPSESKYRP